jgi:hypothetical protein
VLIYTTHITNRLLYIVQTVLGKDCALTSNKENFIAYPDFKINYSAARITDKECFIPPHDLLFENCIKTQDIVCFEWNTLQVFFESEGDIPFDIFAASFYLISRYEEYLPHQTDEYNRYDHQGSIAYTENFLHLPLVNLWWKEFERLTGYQLPERKFCFIPTYDVDIAYAYRYQPIWKNVLGFYRDLLKADFDKVLERGNVYSGKQKDPFDVFEWLDALHTECHIQPIYFFMAIIERGKYDKNLKLSSRGLQRLYRRLSAIYDTGIHPTWRSGDKGSETLLLKEKHALSSLLKKEITKSRQHYLRFTLPYTFRKLAEAGISAEYSMGYGNINGFRASYCVPFFWYDLEKELTTGLELHPFCFMDATAYFEQKETAMQAATELQQYYDLIKMVNGEFICLFHNHFLTEQITWVEWRKMYEGFLRANAR